MTVDERLKNPRVDELFDAILQLRNREECYAFFEDICTVNEIRTMAQRLEVAEKLDAGEHYTDIAEETGASTATISRVKRCLHFGADGYRLVLDRMKSRKSGR
ncbi:MAG: hypothetical protein C4521_13350 [Actinobacteria bacterium]|nr:MAG: hypothetical protein C4521_13350 [Actinomycetota bacterium]